MAVRAWVGRGGAGKTYSAVRYLWRRYKKGRDIYSTTPLIDMRVKWDWWQKQWLPVDALQFGLDWAAGYVTTFDEVMRLDNCDVLLDEVAGWLPSDYYKNPNPDVNKFLSQDRREGVDIVWTHRTTKVYHMLYDNTLELGRVFRDGNIMRVRYEDPQEPKWSRWSVYPCGFKGFDLYQTLARVGDSSGVGYGLGNRQGYRSGTGERILHKLVDWGPFHQSIYVRPEQYLCLLRKFGPETVGLHHQSTVICGIERERWVYGPCEWKGHITWDVLCQKRGYV